MNEDVGFELNDATVVLLNKLHERIQKGNKALLNLALEIGERLVNLQKCHSGTFDKWLETANLNFSRTTAFRYMKLFRKRENISEAKSITEAYEIIGVKKPNEQKESDELQKSDEPLVTPQGFVDILKPYIKVWHDDFIKEQKREPLCYCPYDTEDSEFCSFLKEKGFKVDDSEVVDAKDIDIIIGFTSKYVQYETIRPKMLREHNLVGLEDLLEKSFKCPFAIVMPHNILDDNEFKTLFAKHNKDIQLLIPNEHIPYARCKPSLSAIYVCRNFLPSKLEFVALEHDNSE